jgi:TolA-binding protein
MAKKEENKDLLENAEVLQNKFVSIEHWIESNPKIVLGIIGVIVLALGSVFGYRYYIDNQEDQAQKEMFQAVRYFEQYIDAGSDSLKVALQGDGNNLGLLDIIDSYSGTPAANLANFYVGVIYLKQAKFKAARLYLEDFSSSDQLIQARAYSLIGDTYMEENDFSNAASYYEKASGYKPTKEFSPGYLMKAALAYEKLNKNDKAMQVYEKVIAQYSESLEAQSAKKYLAKLEPAS